MSIKLVVAVAAMTLCSAGAQALAQGAKPAQAVAPPVIPNRVYLVEQLVTPKLPEPLLQQLRPLKTLRQVEELLRANSIPYGWRKAELNTAAAPPALLRQIDALPPGEVFVMPSGENLAISVIIGRK